MMKILFSLLIIICCTACNKAVNTKTFAPKFVVEGWIENDDFPVVKLTHNLPVDALLDSAQLEEIVIRWAKVEVQTDDASEILTLVRDKNIFPYYIYKGTQLRGKTGKKYKLIVTYAENVLTAETSIPGKPLIDNVNFYKVDDSSYQVNLSFTDNAGSKDYYRFYTKPDSSALYSPTTPGGFSDALFNGRSVSFQLFRNRYSNISPYTGAYFHYGDKVNVKLTNMDSISFTCWEAISRETARIPFLNSGGDIPSNIRGAALGIWYGAASSVHTAIAY